VVSEIFCKKKKKKKKKKKIGPNYNHASKVSM